MSSSDTGEKNSPRPATSNGNIDLKNLNWPTVVLILASGVSNFWATNENRTQIDYTRERVYQQVTDLHNAIDDFEKRQKQVLGGIEQSLKNQNTMMDNDSAVLKEVHEIATRFDRYKQVEQMRGAP